MPTRISPVPLVLTMMLLTSAAACRSSDRDRAPDTAAASAAGSATGASSHAVAGGPQAMGGMRDTVVTKVQAHLQRLSTAAPDSLRALVPADREVVNALIADCEQMMRSMRMEPPEKWRNAVRGLRRDLDRMASMTAVQLGHTPAFRVAKVNADGSQAIMTRLGIRSSPTLLLFEEGEVVASLVGAVPQSRVESLLDSHLPPRAA